jgi:hypothetical protein
MRLIVEHATTVEADILLSDCAMVAHLSFQPANMCSLLVTTTTISAELRAI